MKSSFLARAAAAIIALVVPAAAGAQAWPAKPLKIIVPYSPGGTTDLLARLVGAELAKRLKSLTHSGRVDGEEWYRHFYPGTNARLTEFSAAILSAHDCSEGGLAVSLVLC